MFSRAEFIFVIIIFLWFACYTRITGENMHYGTPINPQMPSFVPGGSSSGSAVAVAAELVDFALGTFICLVVECSSKSVNLFKYISKEGSNILGC